VTTRVIGVGSEHLGDDAAGLLTARWVRRAAPAGVEVRECDGEVGRLVELLDGADLVVLVDAARDGRPPGTVRTVDAARIPRPGASSTHGMGVEDALALAAALGRAPREVAVYTVSGAGFGPGPVSPAVARGARRAATRILRDLNGREGERARPAPG
jgi:hydrogenase maturation protease